MKLNRKRVFAKTNGMCAYCGGKAQIIEHIIPKSSGGTNRISNLVGACIDCNYIKGKKTLDDFRLSLHLSNIGLRGMPLKFYDRLLDVGIPECNVKFAYEEVVYG